jgi:hypothetical protein
MTACWRRAAAAGVLLLTGVTVGVTHDGREPVRPVSCRAESVREAVGPAGSVGHRHGAGLHPLTLGLIAFVAVGAAVMLLVMLRNGGPGRPGSTEDDARDRSCTSPEDAPL